MEERIIELETKICYQEQIIEELNQLVTQQQKDIDLLLKFFKKVNEMMKDDSAIVDQSLEVPPPHY